jgi:hypothetical protein
MRGAWRNEGARDVFSCFLHTRYAPQCSLGETVKSGRSVLKVQASGKNCVLASLMADKIESSVLELMFEEVGASARVACSQQKRATCNSARLRAFLVCAPAARVQRGACVRACA